MVAAMQQATKHKFWVDVSVAAPAGGGTSSPGTPRGSIADLAIFSIAARPSARCSRPRGARPAEATPSGGRYGGPPPQRCDGRSRSSIVEAVPAWVPGGGSERSRRNASCRLRRRGQRRRSSCGCRSRDLADHCGRGARGGWRNTAKVAGVTAVWLSARRAAPRGDDPDQASLRQRWRGDGREAVLLTKGRGHRTGCPDEASGSSLFVRECPIQALEKWWAIVGLNHWPSPCQGDALPLS